MQPLDLRLHSILMGVLRSNIRYTRVYCRLGAGDIHLSGVSMLAQMVRSTLSVKLFGDPNHPTLTAQWVGGIALLHLHIC